MAKFNDFRDEYLENFTVFAQIRDLGPIAKQLVNEFEWKKDNNGDTYLKGLDAIRFLARFDNEIHHHDLIDDRDHLVDEDKGLKLFGNLGFIVYDNPNVLQSRVGVNRALRTFDASWFFRKPDLKDDTYRHQDTYNVLNNRKPYFYITASPFSSQKSKFIIENLSAFNSETYLYAKEPVNSLGLVKNQLYFFSSISIFQRSTSEGFPIEMQPQAVVRDVSRISGGPEIFGVNELGDPPLVAGVALTGEQIEQLMTKWPQANDTFTLMPLDKTQESLKQTLSTEKGRENLIHEIGNTLPINSVNFNANFAYSKLGKRLSDLSVSHLREEIFRKNVEQGHYQNHLSNFQINHQLTLAQRQELKRKGITHDEVIELPAIETGLRQENTQADLQAQVNTVNVNANTNTNEQSRVSNSNETEQSPRETIASRVRNFTNRVNTQINQSAQSIGDALHASAQSVQQGFNQASESINQGINRVGQNLNRGFTSASQSVDRVINKTVDLVKDTFASSNSQDASQSHTRAQAVNLNSNIEPQKIVLNNRKPTRSYSQAPAKIADEDRLVVNILNLPPNSDLANFLNFGNTDLAHGRGFTLKGEDARNFLQGVLAVDRLYANDPLGRQPSALDFNIAIEGDRTDLQGVNVHHELGSLALGGDQKSFLKNAIELSFNSGTLTTSQIERVEKLKQQEVAKLPEHDVVRLQDVPEIRHCEEYAIADPLQLDELIIQRNKDLAADYQNRIYLDYVPNSLTSWVASPNSPVKRDPERQQYYISQDDAAKTENFAKISHCVKKRDIYADDFMGNVTLGKRQLANAFNEKNPAKREFLVAEALRECSKEAAAKVPGAIQSYNDIIKVKKMAGRKVGFFKAFTESLAYYKSIANMKKVMRTATAEEAAQLTADMNNLDRKATMGLMRAAANNVTRVLPYRLNAAAQFLSKKQGFELTGQDLSYIADSLSDYVLGKAMYDQKRIHYGYFNDYHPLHNSENFKREVETAFLRNGLDLNAVTNKVLKGEIDKLIEKTNKACEEMSFKVQSAIHASNTTRVELMKELLQVSDNFTHDLESTYKRAEHKEKTVRIFDTSKKELYLAVPEKKRQEFLDSFPEVAEHPLNGSLCVEDVPENREKFKLFLPQEVDKVSLSLDSDELCQRAIKELQQNGYSVDRHNLKLGKWVVDQKDKSKSYVINLDGVPRMQMHDFNGSLNRTVLLGKPSQEEIEKAKANYNQIKANQEAMTRQEQSKRAEQVKEVFDNQVAKVASGTQSDYLARKGLELKDLPNAIVDDQDQVAQQLTQRHGDKAFEDLKGSLICEMTNANGKTMCAQVIDKHGNKFLTPGAPMKGSFFTVGGYDKLANAKTVLIAEGVATAASIAKFAPPDVAVVACMSANNMADVTKSLLHKFPDKGFGIMADNDVKSAGLDGINAGMANAYKTQSLLESVRQIPVVFPPLTSKQLLDGMSDFNDAMQVNAEGTKNRVISAVMQVQEAQERLEKARTKAQMAVNDELLVENEYRRSARRA